MTRLAKVTTPAGESLLFRSLVGQDELGRPFAYDLELLSLDSEIDETTLLGEKGVLELELNDGSIRYFHGIITHFALTGMHGRYWTYELTLRPWLWLLSNHSDCRIFQKISVPDLVQQLFREHGFSDFTDKYLTSGKHPKHEYIVQYRETSLDFVHRMLEEEGIYYYFDHEQTKHTMILADSSSAHAFAEGYAMVPYYPPEAVRHRDHIYSWALHREIRTGAYALNDYNFKQPKAGLLVRSRLETEYAQGDKEFYDYPGDYGEHGDGERLATLRVEERRTGEKTFTGAGNVRGLSSGTLFWLTEFPRTPMNADYLVTSAHYALTVSDYETMAANDESEQFRCTLQAVSAKTHYVPPRVTPRPIIAGPQTAVVVGPPGEEIYTEDGQIKVQFHWDREGKHDAESSCWLRIAQPWAGARWGFIHIPRIGQEVVVEFLEGDPDRPIVTGSVYNATNQPPYALPKHKTQSGIKSRSTKGGNENTYNELRFEDKMGSEEVVIHAQKDMSTTVLHDETHDVKNNLSVKVEEGIYSIQVLERYMVTEVPKDKYELSAKEILELAQEKIELSCGACTITIEPTSITLSMGPTNKITIDEKGVTIVGVPAVSVTGTPAINLNGS